MKIIIKDSKIAAVVTDDYVGSEELCDPPEGFDLDNVHLYVEVDGVLQIQKPNPSQFEFMDSFTNQELDALYGNASAQPKVLMFLDRIRSMFVVDLKDARLLELFGSIVELGYVTQERMNEIMRIQPQI